MKSNITITAKKENEEQHTWKISYSEEEQQDPTALKELTSVLADELATFIKKEKETTMKLNDLMSAGVKPQDVSLEDAKIIYEEDSIELFDKYSDEELMYLHLIFYHMNTRYGLYWTIGK